MKILLINYHYFIHGGPDRYFFNAKKAFEDRGHEVIPFCFDYDETLPTPFRKYFPKPITGQGSYLLANVKINAHQKIKAAQKLFKNRDVDNKFRQIIEDTKPDIIYSIYLSSSFLPNILKIAKSDYRLPVFYRLSDFHMFCPSYLFYRNENICTECLDSLTKPLRYKCVHNSLGKTTLRLLQIAHNRMRRWYDFVDMYICPSNLMKDYLVNHAHFPASKVVKLPSFTQDLSKIPNVTSSLKKPYGLFFGKLIPEKGIEDLLQAYAMIQEPAFDLHIVGHCDTSYLDELKLLVPQQLHDRVFFCGPKQGDALTTELKDSLFCALPSKWLENMPNTITESMSAGKAILTSNIGSLPEVVIHGKNGYLAQAGDIKELAHYLQLISQPETAQSMGKYSRKIFETNYTEQIHMDMLLKLMNITILGSQ